MKIFIRNKASRRVLFEAIKMIGILFLWSSGNQIDNYFWENIVFGVARCGYRYQKQDDGFFVRAGLTPIFMSKDAEGFHSNYFQFWAGVSLGISF